MNKLSIVLLGLLTMTGPALTAPPVNAQDVENWVTRLAADQMRGRVNGSREITEASEWIAGQFEAAGLTPVPGQGSYFQEHDHGKEFPYRNVIGYLKGNDSQLADEYIILSAHYDHIGTKDNMVFNGADDNASGVSAVIGLAHTLAQSKPKRSILFVAWSGEEEGLLGSKYYTEHPLLPLGNAVLNLNFEMVGHTQGMGKRQFWITGAEHSTLYASLKQIGDMWGWKVTASPFPELELFWRSDNVSFVQLKVDREAGAIYGIPAHSISTWGQEGHYHKPNDDADTLDYDNLSGLIEMLAVMVGDLANRSNTIQWKSDSAAPLRPYTD